VAIVVGLAPSGKGASGASGRLGDSAVREVQAILREKEARTPAQRKLDTSLLYAYRHSQGLRMVEGLDRAFPRVSGRARVAADGRVVLDVAAEVTPALEGAIRVAGGEVLSAFPARGALRVRLPLARVVELAARPEVREVRPEQRFLLNSGSVTSEGDLAHAAAALRSRHGVDGTGVKVGVLSDGVDGYYTRQVSGDVSEITIVPGQAGYGSEGLAMLEIVHDLAPGAQLFFATAFEGVASFAANIEALRTTYGCDVIIDDVTYFDEGAFQDGPIARAVNTVAAAGALFFSAAGNSGNLSQGTSGTWEGDFVDSGTTIPPFSGSRFEGLPIHSFNGLSGPASAIGNELLADGYYALTLKWSDPLGASANDYDLFLLDPGLQHVAAFSANWQAGSEDPYEEVWSAPAGFHVVVVRYSGEARALRIDTNRSRLRHATAGATVGHNAGASAISVAAIGVGTAHGGEFTGGPANPLEEYSSDGPRRLFFTPEGVAITPGRLLFGNGGGRRLQKPDVAAADCVATTGPGVYLNPFCGTSAAAPHAGAVAALLLSLPSRPSAEDVKRWLLDTALEAGAPGIDRDSGHGIVMAPRAAREIPRASFYTLRPCRVVDTRGPAGPNGGPALAARSERLFTLAGHCGVPSSARAVAANVVVTEPTHPGHLVLYRGGGVRPKASAINYQAGITRSNHLVVPVAEDGALAVYSGQAAGAAHLVLDVSGYFE
jgi:hypothetical protein